MEMRIKEGVDEVANFIKMRIEEMMEVYSYQLAERLDLSPVRKKIEEKLSLLEENDDEAAYRKSSRELSIYIDGCLDRASLASKKEIKSLFLPSFRPFEIELSERLSNVICKCKN